MRTCWRLLISLFILLFGCKHAEINSVEELTHFLEEPGNNLTRRILMNGYEISVTYTPTDLLVFQDIAGQPADHHRIQRLRQKYDSQYYFRMSLSRNNRDALYYLGSDQYARLLNTLSYGMHDVVELTTSAHATIRMDEHFLKTNFNSGKSTDVMLTFDKGQSLEGKWLKINIREFGLGTGEQEFLFRMDDIKRVPRLKIPMVS